MRPSEDELRAALLADAPDRDEAFVAAVTSRLPQGRTVLNWSAWLRRAVLLVALATLAPLAAEAAAALGRAVDATMVAVCLTLVLSSWMAAGAVARTLRR
ncbi:hypothetical protein [Caulobacter sp. 17J65-9]|uniref:hypothetical protein n=1 Tax=Caulobacter sp. 17J65-9 TaxID=2709382 RepID=UPI0013CB4278|nr:hypothetical protein [Caulobacter sp. 17J65-9]NEX91372.1 hypothetical protein [Caulobacter sp. 17J65-9]